MNDRKRPLKPEELQQLAENLDLDLIECEESLESDPFDSDDSIVDKDYQPSSPTKTNELDSSAENTSGDDSSNETEIAGRPATCNLQPTTNELVDQNNIVWSQVEANIFSPRKVIPPESATVILAKLNRGCSELDCFFTLFPKSLFLFMAHCTNQRLDITQNERGKKKPRLEKTSAKELMLVTGVSLVMHYNRVPTFAMYWSTNPSLGNQAIKNAIARDRCQLLLAKLSTIHRNLKTQQRPII